MRAFELAIVICLSYRLFYVYGTLGIQTVYLFSQIKTEITTNTTIKTLDTQRQFRFTAIEGDHVHFCSSRIDALSSS